MTGTQNMKGGNSGGGAAQWVLDNFGNGSTQWNNVFGPQSNTTQGNLLNTVQGAPAIIKGTYPPQLNPPGYTLKGGKGRRGKRARGRSASRNVRGGGLVSQMAVPATLLAMQQLAYRRKGSRKSGSRRNTRRRGTRRRGTRKRGTRRR